jgi:hypothetical protein
MPREVNWNVLTAEYCEIMGCTERKINEASSLPDHKATHRRLLRYRQDVLKAAKVVKETHDKYPDLSKDELTKEVYRSLVGSVLLLFIFQAFMSVALKMAIEWFINQIFS